jgi:hypothetical protein
MATTGGGEGPRDASAVPSAAKVQGWLPPAVRRQLTRSKPSWLAFSKVHPLHRSFPLNGWANAQEKGAEPGVGMVSCGMRMAFMLDYAAPEADELASFLKAAQVGPPPHTPPGGVALLTFTLARLRVRACERSVRCAWTRWCCLSTRPCCVRT